MLVLSPHINLCFPNNQTSPFFVTGSSGRSGTSSGSVKPSFLSASIAASSLSSKPISERSNPSLSKSPISKESISISQPAFNASLLSAMTYALRWFAVRCANSMVGTLSNLSFLAARTRPCPAMMPPVSSISTGLLNPNSFIDAAIWATWASSCVRELEA